MTKSKSPTIDPTELTKTIDKDREDEMSAAYIKELLKEEGELMYSTESSPSDQEYNYKYHTKKKRPTKKPKSPKQLKDNKELDEKGLRSGAYTEEEQKLFLEGLELFGRNWKEISKFIKTRDVPSIKSKAQQHFVKLFRDKMSLPKKVLETGDGYTLSGKPLDPLSASARKYIFTPEDEALKKKDLFTKKLPIANSKKVEQKEQNKNEIRIFGTQIKSTYSIERLRKNPKKLQQKPEFNDQSYLLIKCSSYVPRTIQEPALEKYKQPFDVVVSNIVLALMDFHCHFLERNEVIGLLGGDYSKETSTLSICACYPARSTQQNIDNLVSVELDAVSEVEIREKAQSEGLKIVGWYHSHPTFEPNPSVVDLEYQQRYQNLVKADQGEKVPFVGCIVSPYLRKSENQESIINWFNFNSYKSAYEMETEELSKCAKTLKVEVSPKYCIPKRKADYWFEFYKQYDIADCVNFTEFWQENISFEKKVTMCVQNHLNLSKKTDVPNKCDLVNDCYNCEELINKIQELIQFCIDKNTNKEEKT